MPKSKSHFGSIQRVNPNDLPSKPTQGQSFDMNKISKLSHKIAQIEHEKRSNSERSE